MFHFNVPGAGPQAGPLNATLVKYVARIGGVSWFLGDDLYKLWKGRPDPFLGCLGGGAPGVIFESQTRR